MLLMTSQHTHTRASTHAVPSCLPRCRYRNWREVVLVVWWVTALAYHSYNGNFVGTPLGRVSRGVVFCFFLARRSGV